jgi:hypothetical protein
MLKNGSFTEGWTDLPPVGMLINQQPKHWKLRWIEPGDSLFGAGDKSRGVPECVHKLANQLPLNEQIGAPDALILEGDATYKIFHAGAPFGAELVQTVEGLEPGSTAQLTVPIQVHLHNDADPYAAESGVWVNGEGHWVNGRTMEDRKWYDHEVAFTVPDDGKVEIAIRVKSKWPRSKDFFFDGIKLEAIAAEDVSGPVETGAEESVVKISVPAGVEVMTKAGDDPNVVIVTIPDNFTVKIVRDDEPRSTSEAWPYDK